MLTATSDNNFFTSKGSSSSASTTSVVVTTTTRIRKNPAAAEVPVKKRKSDSATALPKNVKRLRPAAAEEHPKKKKTNKRPESASSSIASSSRASSRQPRQSSPEPIYRTESRSASTLPRPPSPARTGRNWACKSDFDAQKADTLSAEMVVQLLVKKSNSYKAFFRNLDDPTDTSFEVESAPVVELEYPNSNSSERFLLLAPKDKDHYNPIMCLEKTLHTIVECYMTPEQQALFGTIPDDNNLIDAISASPSPSPPPSRRSTSSAASDLSALTSSSTSSLSSLSPSSSRSSSPDPAPTTASKPLPALPRPNHLRILNRAIQRQNGPLFLSTMSAINQLLRSLKYPSPPADMFLPRPPNALTHNVHLWGSNGLPKKVLMRVLEENYQRSVGPNIAKLRQYEAFTSTVYGELMPSLSYDIIKRTGLNEHSRFMDLGSGVANVVVQASLQTGCHSFGVELVDGPAGIAGVQVKEFRKRTAMWGLDVGVMELEHGDMVRSAKVDRMIAQADVVLVDNKVFEQSLNEALRPKFLDLKEGAVVVSLAPFVSSLNARVTERNVDDISAIFDVTEHRYNSGSVSWGNGAGSYYIHRVDRTGYAKIRERFENSRGGGGGGSSAGGSTRTTRSRR